MAFNAGSIEATLTLNRNPFTAGLAAARKQANEFERNDLKADIKIGLDKASVQKTRQELRDFANKSIQNITRIKVGLDNASLVKTRADLRAFVATGIRQTIKVGVELDKASLTTTRAAFRAFVTSLGGTAKVNVNVDTAAARAQLNRLGAERHTANVNIDVDNRQLFMAEQMLNVIDARRYTIHVNVDVDQNSLTQIINGTRRLGDEADRTSGRMDNMGNSGSRSFGRMGGQMRALIALGPLIIPVLGSAIVALTGLVGALTSILGVAAVGVGAFAIVAVPAFKKITDAVKAGQAAINALPPGLRDAANALKTLQTTWEGLQKATQGSVGGAFAAGFSAANAALKTLQPIIEAVAGSLTRTGKLIEQYFGTEHWKTFVDYVAKNVGPVLDGLFKIVAYGTRFIMNLMEAFQPLADWLLPAVVQGMKDFADWIERIAKTPEFAKFLIEAKDAIQAVWGFLKQLVISLFDLAVAVAPLGNIILNVLTFIFQGLSKLPPEWLAGIAVGLSAIFAAILLGASGPVGIVVGLIVGLAAAFAALYKNSEPFRKFVDDFNAQIKTAFTPIWENLVTLWNDKVVPAWDNLVAKYQDMKPVIDDLVKKFVNDFIPALGDFLKVVVEDVIPGLLNFIAAIAPVVIWLVKAFGTAAIDEVKTFFGILGGALKTVGGLLDVFADIFSGNFSKIPEDLKKVGDGILTVLGAIFGTDLEGIKKFFEDIWTGIVNFFKTIWTDVTTWIAGVWQAISDKAVEIWTGIGHFFETIWDTVTTALSDAWNGVVTFLSDVWTKIQSDAKTIWDAITGFLSDTWNGIVNLVKTVFSGTVNYLTSLFRAHEQLIHDVWNGISGFFSMVFGGIRDTAVAIWTDISNYFSIQWNALSDDWNRIWDGISSFFSMVFGGIRDTAVAIWSDITTYFSIQWKALSDDWNKIWDGIKNFFETTWNWISSTAVTVWNTISAYFTARWQVLSDFWGGIWQGVANFFQTIWNTISSVAQTVWNAIAGFFSGALNNFLTWWSGIWNMLVSDFQRIWGGVVAIADMIWAGVKDTFKRGVNGAVGIINGMLHGVNTVLSFLLIPNIPDIPMMASGGVLSQEVEYFASGGAIGGGFVTNRPTAIVGEGNPNYPEYVIPTDPTYRRQALSLYESAGTKLMASGGVFGGASGSGSAPVTSAKGTVTGVSSLDLGSLLGKATGFVTSALGAFNNSLIGKIGKGIVNKMKGAVLDKVSSAVKSAMDALAALVTGGGNSATPAGRAGNVSAVQAAAARYGWGSGAQWDALVKLVNSESGFNNVAQNPTSTAYGMFQFLNGTWAGYGAAKTSDPGVQAAAGLRYISSKYGSPAAAWAFHQSHNWYDQGGMLEPGMTMAINRSGGPERILTRSQTANFDKLIQLLENGAGTGGGNVTNVNLGPVYNPIGEPAVDTLMKRVRTASDMGLFGDDE